MSAPLSESFSIGTSDDGLSFARILEREAERKRLGGASASALVNGTALEPKENPTLLSLRQHAVDARVLAEQPPLKWLFRGLIKRGQAGLVTGAWKAGKSMAAIHLAFARVLQIPIAPAGANHAKEFGSVVGGGGNAVYVACERGGSIPGRLKAWQQLHDPNWEKLNASGGKVLYYAKPLNLILEDVGEGLRRFCEENEADFVIIDTLRSSVAGTPTAGDKEVENSQRLMTLLMEGAGCLAERLCGAAAVLHHPPKADVDGTSGAGSIEGSASFKIAVKNDSGARSLELKFNNDAGADDVRIDFRVQEVAVGVDDEGDTITAAAFVPLSGGYQKSPAPQNKKALHILASALDEKGQISPATAIEAIKTQAPEIKSPRTILNRLRREGCLEQVGTDLGFTDKGRRSLQITLGERRVPLEAAS